MRNLVYSGLIGILCWWPTSVQAQSDWNDPNHKRETLVEKFIYPPDTTGRQADTIGARVRVLPLPSLGFSPETNLQMGIYTFFVFNLFPDEPNTRRSDMDFEVAYTLNNQFWTETRFNFITSQEKWFLNGQVQFHIFPENYYGLGNQSRAIDEENYDAKRLNIDLSALKNLKPGRELFIGPRFRTLWMFDIESSLDDGFFANGEVPDGEGGLYMGLGGRFQWDQRRGYTVTNPRDGHFISLSAVGFNEGWASDASFGLFEADFRKYWSPTTRVRDVIAVQLLGQAAPGAPPFRMMPMIGSSRDMRAYYRGRFRDDYYASTQLEYRVDLWWRLGLVLWGGVGEVWGPHSELGWQHLKPSYGGGFRFKIDRENDVNIRIDYGIGTAGNRGLYLGLGEAF